MSEAFIAGGWGMYPTLLAGLALLAACVRYARRPQARDVPLMLCLGLFTLFAGALGFLTGLMNLLGYAASAQAPAGPTVLYLGVREALHNLALALLLTMGSALAASVGAWRLAQRTQSLSGVEVSR